MRIRINEDELPEDDVKPWNRHVEEGWHDATVRRAVTDFWGDGSHEVVAVEFAVATAEGEAWLRSMCDTEEAAGLRRLAMIARACGADPSDFELAELERVAVTIRVGHKPKRNGGGVFCNVVEVRARDRDAPNGEDVGDLPF